LDIENPLRTIAEELFKEYFFARKEVRHGHYDLRLAVLPKSIAEEHAHFVRQDLELFPLDLSMIKR
jgi:hypothetical protein